MSAPRAKHGNAPLIAVLMENSHVLPRGWQNSELRRGVAADFCYLKNNKKYSYLYCGLYLQKFLKANQNEIQKAKPTLPTIE